MAFDPDKALKEARESVHGFYMDGPSEAESTVENLRALLMCMFEQERKLKLERLMWKAYGKSEYCLKNNSIQIAIRWNDLSSRCHRKLQELKR